MLWYPKHTEASLPVAQGNADHRTYPLGMGTKENIIIYLE